MQFNIFQVFLAVITFLFFYIVLELVKIRYKVDAEITRKIAHMASGLASLLFYTRLTKFEFVFTVLYFLIFFCVVKYKKLLKSIVLLSRSTIGEITYPLGLLVLIIGVYESPFYFIPGILVLSLSDAFAGLIGSKFNKSAKTFAGSFIFFLTTIGIFAFTFGLSPFVIIMSAALTLAELLSSNGWDNYTIPLTYITIIKLFV